MKLSNIVTYLCLSLLFCQSNSPALDAKKVTPTCRLQLIWSAPHTEINAPSFMADGNEILFAKKLHEPDGHEAECYSESELMAMQGLAKKNSKDKARWADPEVVAVNLQNGSLERFDYGWNGVGSKDGNKIYYAHQVQPITGFRLLAQTQRGNEICAFNRTTNSISIVAQPQSGYLADPILSSDGKKLAYALCDSVNGDWGGQVGIGIIDLASGENTIALAPSKHRDLFDLIGPMFWAGDQLITVREIASAGGMYMGMSYDRELLNVTPGRAGKQLYKTSDNAFKLKAYPNLNNTVTVNADKQYVIDVHTGQVLKETPPEKTYYVPNDDGSLCVRKVEKYFEIFDLKNNKSICKFDDPESSDPDLEGCNQPQFIWSPDSTKLAIVFDRAKSGVFDHSELLLVDLNSVKSKL